MDNKISLLMLAAIFGYLIFIFYKWKNFSFKKETSGNNKYFCFLLLGMLFGFLFGIFFSPSLTEIIFSEEFLKKYMNPDIGEAVFYILITFILTIFFGIAFPLIYEFTKNVFFNNNKNVV